MQADRIRLSHRKMVVGRYLVLEQSVLDYSDVLHVAIRNTECLY